MRKKMSGRSGHAGLQLFLAALLILGMLMLAGCAPEKTETQEKNSAGYTVADARGKTLHFAEKPRKIVSLHVYADEILLDLVDHSRIAGMDRWIHDPDLSMSSAEAKDITTVVESNLESVLKVHPDLLIVSDMVKPDFIKSLEDMGVKVFVYRNQGTLESISQSVRSIGKAVGEDRKAESLIAEMERKLAETREKTGRINPEQRKKAVLFLRFGAIGGQGCIYHDTMEAAGIHDCYDDVRKPEKLREGMSRILSKEEVVRSRPDVFLVSTWTQGGSYKNPEEQLALIYDDPAYSGLPAVQRRAAYIIPQSYVNCLSHRVGDAVVRLHGIVYGKE